MNSIGLINKIKAQYSNFLFRKQYPSLSKFTDEYIVYLSSLFSRVANTDGFAYLYTLPRVDKNRI